jgi:hypothetical protein
MPYIDWFKAAARSATGDAGDAADWAARSAAFAAARNAQNKLLTSIINAAHKGELLK